MTVEVQIGRRWKDASKLYRDAMYVLRHRVITRSQHLWVQVALGHSYVIKKGPGGFRQRAFSLSGGLMDLTNLGCILKVLITPTVKWHLNLPNCHGSIAKARIKGSGERASA